MENKMQQISDFPRTLAFSLSLQYNKAEPEQSRRNGSGVSMRDVHTISETVRKNK